MDRTPTRFQVWQFIGWRVRIVCAIGITGIIGNRIDAGFVRVLALLNKTIPTPYWAWVIVVLFFGSIAGLATLKLIRDKQEFDKITKFLNDLNNLDDFFFTLLNQLDVEPNVNHGLKKLIDAYLGSIFDIFDASHPQQQTLDECHVVIYRPNKENTYLIPWYKSINAPDVNNHRFPLLANVGQPCGIAGKAYNSDKINEVFVVNLSKKANSHWIADDPQYIYFFGSNMIPSHKTLAAIALVDRSGISKIGVLCFYSMNPEAFKSKKFKTTLMPMFAKRISTAIQFGEKIRPI